MEYIVKKYNPNMLDENPVVYRGSRGDDFKKIIQLIEDGKIDTSPWITHRAALEEVPERFTDWLNPASGVLKAVVSVGD